jgi:hypothetical protein
MEDRPEHGLDCLVRRAAFLCRDNKPELVALDLALLALVERGQAGGFEKALDGFVRRADTRALALLGDVGLLGRDAVDHQGEAPRGDVGRGTFEFEPGFLEPLGDEAFQIVGGARLHARRDLFGEQF